MDIEKERADFESWLYLDQTKYDPEQMSEQEIEIAKQAYLAGRAASRTQEQPIPYAGVTVWVGNKRCSHGVTKDELELSNFDILQAAFDLARRDEGDHG